MPAGSPSMTWTQLCTTFLEKYIPRSMHKCHRVVFSKLMKMFITVVEHEARIYKQAKHDTMVILIDYKKI